MIATYKPGTTVELQLARNGGGTVIKAQLGEAPGDTTTRKMPIRRP